MTGTRKGVATGGVVLGLAAALALAGPVSAANPDPAREQRVVRIDTAPAATAEEGFWHYTGFWSAQWLCEVVRAARSATHPTDGCYREPSAGWYFWWFEA